MKARRVLNRYTVALAWCVLVFTAGVGITLRLVIRPEVLEAKLRAALDKVLVAPVEFDALEISGVFAARLRGVRLGSGAPQAPQEAPDQISGGSAFLGASSVTIVPDLSHILTGRVEVGEVVVNDPILRISRDSSGRWNFLDLFRAGVFDKPASDELKDRRSLERIPALNLRGGRVEFEDLCAPGGPFSAIARDLDVTLRAIAPGTGEFRLRFTIDSVPFDIQGRVSHEKEGPVFYGTISIRRIELSRLSTVLPASIASALAPWNLKGFADLRLELCLGSDSRLRLVDGELRWFHSSAAPPGFPYPVRNLEGTLSIAEKALDIQSARAVVAGSEISLSAALSWDDPWLALDRLDEWLGSRATWNLRSLEVKALPVDSRLRDLLPQGSQSAFRDFQPSGTVNLRLDETTFQGFPPPPDAVAATVELMDCGFCFHKFPYPVRKLRGTIRVEKGWLRLKDPLTSEIAGMRCWLSGRGFELHRDGELDLSIRVERVPLDETFRGALPDDVQDTWDTFQATGSGDGLIGVTRGPRDPSLPELDENGEVRPVRLADVLISVTPRSLRISYAQFPYEIRDITGSVTIDLKGKTVRLDDLVGYHGDRRVTGSGLVRIGKPESLLIEIGCDELAVDEDLKRALSPEGRRMLDDFGFGGVVRASVTIRKDGEEPTVVTSNLDIQSATLSHKDFPFALDLVGGEVRLLGDSSFRWQGVSTPGDAKPYVVLGGSLDRDGTKYDLSFNVDVANLELDDRLLVALPDYIARFLMNLRFGGTYQGRLETTYRVDESDPSTTEVQYVGKGLRVTDGFLDFGLKLRELQAKGDFRGRKAGDSPLVIEGQVGVESARFNRLRLGRGTVDVALGTQLEEIRLAERGESWQGRDYIPHPSVAERLKASRVDHVFQMGIRSDEVYGGQVDGVIFVDTGRERDMGGDLVGRGLQVSRAADDVFGTSGSSSYGSASGRITFQGGSASAESLRGRGEGKIVDAKLAEVPLFFGLLSLLFGEASSRHYFTDVSTSFEIDRGHFVAPSSGGIEIRSPAVSLSGGGTLDFEGNLDLLFQTHLMDVRIPFLEFVFSLLKKGLAQVAIRGDLSEPKVDFVTGAGMVRIGLGTAGGSESGGAATEDAPTQEASEEAPDVGKSATPDVPANRGPEGQSP